jgi:anti-sigma regulatory factor (Ser/Thr protein kinase)
MIHSYNTMIEMTQMVLQNAFIVERRWISHPANVHFARAAIRDFVRRYYAGDSLDMIELAIGEACANAVEHGSPHGQRNTFTVRCGLSPERTDMVFEVEDEGEDFPLNRLRSLDPVPDLVSEGGRGLYLMNEIMDQVALLSSRRGVIVRMTKRIPAASMAA